MARAAKSRQQKRRGVTDQSAHQIVIRNTQADDFPAIIEMTREVYGGSRTRRPDQLASHLEVFPEAQFVAVELDTRRIVGMSANLVVVWDNYDIAGNPRDFSGNGGLSSHDPVNGRTLYSTQMIVRPLARDRGIGVKLYAARRQVAEDLGLRRIRAVANLRGYHRYADCMCAQNYVTKVVNDELRDLTLSFMLKRDFHVIAVIPDHWRNDSSSLGFAAIIEWINERVAKPADYAGRDPRFIKKQKAKEPGKNSH